jgi:hypothetical protein
LLLAQGVPFLTIHDAFAVVTTEAEATRQIMAAVISEFGVTPTIKIDWPTPKAGHTECKR